MGSFVQLTSADGFHCPAYVAQPAGQPKGGLVVLQEIFGVNSHIQAVADGYAAEGYFVVAPSTFHRVKAGVDLGYTEADMGAGMALKTAVEALQQQIDRLARNAGQRRHRRRSAVAVHEHRIDEIVGREPRLARNPSREIVAPHPAHASRRKAPAERLFHVDHPFRLTMELAIASSVTIDGR